MSCCEGWDVGGAKGTLRVSSARPLPDELLFGFAPVEESPRQNHPGPGLSRAVD